MTNLGKIEFEQVEKFIKIEIIKELLLELIKHRSYTTTKDNITVELFLDKLQAKEIEKIINQALDDRAE